MDQPGDSQDAVPHELGTGASGMVPQPLNTETDDNQMEFDTKSDGELEDNVSTVGDDLPLRQDQGGTTPRSSATADSESTTTTKQSITGQTLEGPRSCTSDVGGGVQTSTGPPSSVSVEDQAKAYIKKKKDEQIALLKASLGEKLLDYETVNAPNRRRLSAPYLQSGAAAEFDEFSADEGDFFSSGDGRAGIMYTSINLQWKHNLSFSFIPQRKVCTLCPTAKEHTVLGTPRGGNIRSPGKEVFILADQSYPPLLPSSSDKSCIRIIRLEFGSLHELVTIFLELLEGRFLASGSLVLIFSATHLANVGLAAYIEDLVATKKRILGGLGRDIHFAPAPPMLLNGTGNRDLICSTFCLTDWVEDGAPEELSFAESNRRALDSIIDNGKGGGQPFVSTRLRLHTSMDSHEKRIWAVFSNSEIPNKMGPLSVEHEGGIVTSLISEIKKNLAIELDPNPISSRHLCSRSELTSASYLVVGSSNARRLQEALQEKGIATRSIICNNWRATKKSVDELAGLVKEELAHNFHTAVIYQLLDNNIFFSKFEDGSLCPARKALDGHYHVDGELVVASRETMLSILKLCAPLFEAASGLHMVVVGPLPRYVKHSCCLEEDHITNRLNPDYYLKMKQDLSTCCRAVKVWK